MKLGIDIDIESIAKIVSKTVTVEIKKHLNFNHSKSDDILDVKGLAVYLKVTEQWVYKQVIDKSIPHFKVGKFLRFRQHSIDNWLEDQSVPDLNHSTDTSKIRRI